MATNPHPSHEYRKRAPRLPPPRAPPRHPRPPHCLHHGKWTLQSGKDSSHREKKEYLKTKKKKPHRSLRSWPLPAPAASRRCPSRAGDVLLLPSAKSLPPSAALLLPSAESLHPVVPGPATSVLRPNPSSSTVEATKGGARPGPWKKRNPKLKYEPPPLLAGDGTSTGRRGPSPGDPPAPPSSAILPPTCVRSMQALAQHPI
ncbi:splicing factor, proline- and glutamine-rich-like [Triticum urartu]|uniref:splicing factor, proline- and glutamine-rich-like n=1 Tax=Triticum urartu TaxID=4572 RepID=UPI00204338D4|nr:splicing factor, proline- and glutamine-rich-like [Triticum urartu]